jgi:hypothetical protein
LWDVGRVIVGYIGWLLWSNFAPSRSVPVDDSGPVPQQAAAAPAAAEQSAGNGAANLAQRSGSGSPLIATVAPSNGSPLSIEISSLSVTTRPDNLADILAAPDGAQEQK